MRQWTVLFLLLFGFVTPALSADADLTMQQARDAFGDGAFVEAAMRARRFGSSEGYAFAARADLVFADFIAVQDDRLMAIARGEADARRAIALAPDLAEGHLQLAVALGFRGRREGHMSAHFKGLATEAREHLDLVVEREPDNAWGHALLGGWHLEISEAGGFLGRAIYGASIDGGIAEYSHALELRPGDLVIIAQCALQLAAFNDAEYLEQAKQLIATVVVPADLDVPHRLMLKRLRDLEAALAGGDEAEIARVVRVQKGERSEVPKPLAPQPTSRGRPQAHPPIGLPR